MSLTLSTAQAAIATHHVHIQVFTQTSTLSHQLFGPCYHPTTAVNVPAESFLPCFHCWMRRTLATCSRLAAYLYEGATQQLFDTLYYHQALLTWSVTESVLLVLLIT